MWAQGKPRGRGDRRLCKPGGSQGVETARSLSGHPRAASWPGGGPPEPTPHGPLHGGLGHPRAAFRGTGSCVHTTLPRRLVSQAVPCACPGQGHMVTLCRPVGPRCPPLAPPPAACPRPRGASQAEQLWLQPLRPGTFIHINTARNPGHVTGARAGQRGRTFARRPPPGGRGRRREGACGKASLRARRPAG